MRAKISSPNCRGEGATRLIRPQHVSVTGRLPVQAGEPEQITQNLHAGPAPSVLRLNKNVSSHEAESIFCPNLDSTLAIPVPHLTRCPRAEVMKPMPPVPCRTARGAKYSSNVPNSGTIAPAFDPIPGYASLLHAGARSRAQKADIMEMDQPVGKSRRRSLFAIWAGVQIAQMEWRTFHVLG